MVRNRVGGPVVNETEHKTINWNSDDQVHVLVLYKGLVHVPMHGPPGLDSVPPIVGNVPILVKEVGVRSVVGFLSRRAQPRNTPNAFANTKPNIIIEYCKYGKLYQMSLCGQNTQHLLSTLNGCPLKGLAHAMLHFPFFLAQKK